MRVVASAAMVAATVATVAALTAMTKERHGGLLHGVVLPGDGEPAQREALPDVIDSLALKA